MFKTVCVECWWDFNLLPFRWLFDKGLYCKHCQSLKLEVAQGWINQEEADEIIEKRREVAFDYQ